MSIVEHNVRYYGDQIDKIAGGLEVEPAALHAVAAVEVGEIPYPGLGAPIIRFEVHKFLQRFPSSKTVQLRTTSPSGEALTAWHKDAHWYKSDPDDDWQRVHSGSQGDEWAAMIQAQSEDPTAAWECASYGVGQLMGWHWDLIGCNSVQRMVGQATGGGVDKQIEQWARYIEADHDGAMLLALQQQDWETFVRYYNGPGQVEYYTNAMLKRYDEAVKVLADPPMDEVEISLDTWLERQQALVDLGYDPGPVDGIYGNQTKRAIKAFQADNGLTPDGIWGRYTEEHIRRALAQVS